MDDSDAGTGTGPGPLRCDLVDGADTACELPTLLDGGDAEAEASSSTCTCGVDFRSAFLVLINGTFGTVEIG